jgi:uncharacterized protein YgfB (UPF0149 family)
MRKNKVIYRLIVEDVQNVAQQELDRDLSDAEIEKILDEIAENISWYDAIANAIQKLIVVNSE